jgi:chitinase
VKRRTRIFSLAAGAALVIPSGTAAEAGAASADSGIFPVAPYAYTDTGTNLANYASSSGQKDFTIAFVLAGNGCQASWNGDNTVSADPASPDSVEQEINSLRDAGGDVSISFGGADGTYLDQNCSTASTLAQQYENVIAGTGTRQVDFDIEQGYGDQGREQRVAQAVAMMQQHQTSIGQPVAVTYTLGVGTDGLPTGSGSQYEVAQYAVNAGVDLAAVNIMTMDYGSSGTEMGTAAEQAATGTEKQLETLLGVGNAWSRLGITPMIGPNDTPGETFTLSDAADVESFAQSKGVGYLSFWEMANDNSGYTGEADWAYSRTFETYTGTS